LSSRPAAPSLLDSYAIERKPIAQSRSRYVERLLPDRQDIRIREDEYGLLETAMGYRTLDVIIAENSTAAHASRILFTQAGAGNAPGACLVRRGDETLSRCLIGRDFMLYRPRWRRLDRGGGRVGLVQARRLASAALGLTSMIPKGCFYRACAFRLKARSSCVPTDSSAGVREAEAPIRSQRSKRVLRACAVSIRANAAAVTRLSSSTQARRNRLILLQKSLRKGEWSNVHPFAGSPRAIPVRTDPGG
jgi:hypothetical protein